MNSVCDTIYEEKWAWVDQRLAEMFYSYGLTEDNVDDYIDAGLLGKSGDWIDEQLLSQYKGEFEDRLPCPAPLKWVLYKNYESQYCLEEEESTSSRSRAESDISDHSAEVERVLRTLDLQSLLQEDLQRPLEQGMYPINYSHLYAVADEAVSVEETFGSCSPISNYSDTTELDMDDECYDFGYDSF